VTLIFILYKNIERLRFLQCWRLRPKYLNLHNGYFVRTRTYPYRSVSTTPVYSVWCQ